MPSRPLFNEQELAAAFALLLPQQEAVITAERWFAMMASPTDLDDDGNYLAEEADWRRDQDSPVNVVVVSTAEQHVPSSGGYEKLRGQSLRERIDFLLHLSDFHLRLVMLTSDEAFERLVAFLDYDSAKAERVRTQMKLIVQVMGVSID